jgi:alkylation response protein AidB-like acyl-CoA dehydrogenase
VHFGLVEEQELLQETVRSFVAGECPPARRRALFEAGSGHDPALWKGLAEIGLTGLVVPEAHGGAGLELLDLALACEVLGEGALPTPLAFHALACLAIAAGGSREQRARWLPALASGEAVGTIALSDAAGLPQGGAGAASGWGALADGGRLRGEVRQVPAAEIADVIVVGVVGGAGPGAGALALAERGAAGVSVAPASCVDRTRPLFDVRFDATPCDPLAGDAQAGQDAAPPADRVRDAALSLLAADAFGGAWQLTRVTADHARARRQFGRPIAEFQAVKHQLADMATAIEPTRGLFWYSAHAFDHLPGDAAHAAAIAKAHITDRAVEIARQAVELHGGIGFTWECDVQIWLKRAMFDRVFLGTPEQHRARAAALAGW